MQALVGVWKEQKGLPWHATNSAHLLAPPCPSRTRSTMRIREGGNSWNVRSLSTSWRQLCPILWNIKGRQRCDLAHSSQWNVLRLMTPQRCKLHIHLNGCSLPPTHPPKIYHSLYCRIPVFKTHLPIHVGIYQCHSAWHAAQSVGFCPPSLPSGSFSAPYQHLISLLLTGSTLLFPGSGDSTVDSSEYGVPNLSDSDYGVPRHLVLLGVMFYLAVPCTPS